MAVDVDRRTRMTPPARREFHPGKVRYLVVQESDLECSTDFHPCATGCKGSDVSCESRMPGGMALLRRKTDHCPARSSADDPVGTNGPLSPASDWHGGKSLQEAIENPMPGQDMYLPR